MDVEGSSSELRVRGWLLRGFLSFLLLSKGQCKYISGPESAFSKLGSRSDE